MNEQQAQEVEAFASGLLSPSEISEVLELDKADVMQQMQQKHGPFYTAYRKGVLKLKYRLNVKNIEFAEQASSHAMNKVLKMLDELKLIIENERDEA
jgi:hypothetical protein